MLDCISLWSYTFCISEPCSFVLLYWLFIFLFSSVWRVDLTFNSSIFSLFISLSLFALVCFSLSHFWFHPLGSHSTWFNWKLSFVYYWLSLIECFFSLSKEHFNLNTWPAQCFHLYPRLRREESLLLSSSFTHGAYRFSFILLFLSVWYAYYCSIYTRLKNL